MGRFVTDERPVSDDLPTARSNFYREEFVKLQRCLDRHREYYSEGAIQDVEMALMKILSQIDRLSIKDDADQVVCRLLRKFDVLTKLSAWTDPQHVH